MHPTLPRNGASLVDFASLNDPKQLKAYLEEEIRAEPYNSQKDRRLFNLLAKKFSLSDNDQKSIVDRWLIDINMSRPRNSEINRQYSLSDKDYPQLHRYLLEHLCASQ